MQKKNHLHEIKILKIPKILEKILENIPEIQLHIAFKFFNKQKTTIFLYLQKFLKYISALSFCKCINILKIYYYYLYNHNFNLSIIDSIIQLLYDLDKLYIYIYILNIKYIYICIILFSKVFKIYYQYVKKKQ